MHGARKLSIALETPSYKYFLYVILVFEYRRHIQYIQPQLAVTSTALNLKHDLVLHNKLWQTTRTHLCHCATNDTIFRRR